jgi:hypothetical protein
MPRIVATTISKKMCWQAAEGKADDQTSDNNNHSRHLRSAFLTMMIAGAASAGSRHLTHQFCN